MLEADAELRVGSDKVLDEPVRILGAVGPQTALRFEVAAVARPDAGRSRTGRTDAPATGDVLGDYFGTNGVSLVAGKAVVVQAEAGAVERRVRNAAEAGAAAVLVSGTSLPGRLARSSRTASASPSSRSRPRRATTRSQDGGVLELAARREALPNAALMDVAAFSSGGVAFDGRVKPDLVAPGVGLATADAGGDGFATVTGSSAAAAVVAGAAALVAEARPNLSALDLKSALVGSGGRLLRDNLALPVTAQGGGLVDPTHAATAEIAVEPATLAFGRAEGPGWSAARVLTVRNVSSRPLTLSFGLLADGPAPPALAFSVDPAELTLEPGEVQDVTIGVSAPATRRRRERAASSSSPPTALSPSASPGRSRAARPSAPRSSATCSSRTTSSRRPTARRSCSPSVRAGSTTALDGEMIEPVGVLELELWTADGRKLGVLARLRDVLPGRYAFGLTGRGPQGKVLPDGAYVLRLRAHPVDGDDGTQPSTAEAVFSIRR